MLNVPLYIKCNLSYNLVSFDAEARDVDFFFSYH